MLRPAMQKSEVTHATAHAAITLGAGILFSIGLAISGMTVPSNVIGFLDLFGTWNPMLAFVIIGAIAIHAPIYWLFVRRRGEPSFARTFAIPTRRDIDLRLLTGASLFGIGWGLAGFCPGPAVVSLGTGTGSVWVFVAAMLAGMAVFHLFDGKERAR